MSDDWDDAPRRRRRYEPVDVRRAGSHYSGGVTGAGVFSIIIGSLSLLCFMCSGFFGVMFLIIGEADRQQAAMLPQSVGLTGGMLISFAFLYLSAGVCYLIAGILTLQRRHGGRTLALIMAGVSVLLGIGNIVLAVLGLMGASPVLGGDASSQAVTGAVYIVAGMVFLAHAAVVFITLLNSYNIAEFE